MADVPCRIHRSRVTGADSTGVQQAHRTFLPEIPRRRDAEIAFTSAGAAYGLKTAWGVVQEAFHERGARRIAESVDLDEPDGRRAKADGRRGDVSIPILKDYAVGMAANIEAAKAAYSRATTTLHRTTRPIDPRRSRKLKRGASMRPSFLTALLTRCYPWPKENLLMSLRGVRGGKKLDRLIKEAGKRGPRAVRFGYTRQRFVPTMMERRIADVAAMINEFGAPERGIPERPAFRRVAAMRCSPDLRRGATARFQGGK